MVTANGTLVYATKAETTVVDPVTGENFFYRRRRLILGTARRRWRHVWYSDGVHIQAAPRLSCGFSELLLATNRSPELCWWTLMTCCRLHWHQNGVVMFSYHPEALSHLRGWLLIDLIHYGPADSTFVQNHRRLPKQAQWFVFNKELRQFYGLREGCRHRV